MKFFTQTIGGIKAYFSDRERSYSRIIQFSKLSVIINAVIALVKIGMSIYSPSFFLCINGFYNLGIGTAKVVAIKGYEESRKLPDKTPPGGYKKEEYRCYLLVGIIVLFASLMYTIYSICILSGTRGKLVSSGLMVIVIGIFTGIEIILSLRGIITSRRWRNPFMEAIKMTNFVSAMISIVLTQKVISSRPGHISSNFLNLEGVVFGTLSVIVGIYMIVNIYRVIHGKNHNSIIKKANMIMRKHSAKSNVIAVKYEDNGPNERILYLQVDELNESIEIAKAEIESKMHLEVRNIKCSEYL